MTVSKVSTVFDVVCLLLILIQMYAVSIMTRVCDAGTRPYFVMIQLWLTSCLIPTFTSIIYVGKTPADIAYMVLRGNEFFFLFRCVLVFLYVVSWKRIARTYLFAGKGQNVETVPYSPLNKFLVGPLVCIAVVIVLSIVIRLILN